MEIKNQSSQKINKFIFTNFYMNKKRKGKLIILPKNKKGQFYLIAAIIIIAIIIGFAAVKNYTQRREVIKLYNLGQELGIESENVLDYGTYNGLNEDEIEELLTSFVEGYASYSSEGKNLYFIFGNWKKINVIAYQDLATEIYIGIGEELTLIEPGEEYEFTATEGESIHDVSVIIENLTYDFELQYGENFYFIISQEIEGEQYVVTS